MYNDMRTLLLWSSHKISLHQKNLRTMKLTTAILIVNTIASQQAAGAEPLAAVKGTTQTSNEPPMGLVQRKLLGRQLKGTAKPTTGRPTSSRPTSLPTPAPSRSPTTRKPTSLPTSRPTFGSGPFPQGSVLLQNEQLMSANGCYKLIMEGDGRLVGYNSIDQEFWSSFPSNSNLPYFAKLTGVGLLQVYAQLSLVWTSGCEGGTGPGNYNLSVQDNRDIVIKKTVSGVATTVWSSGTSVGSGSGSGTCAGTTFYD